MIKPRKGVMSMAYNYPYGMTYQPYMAQANQQPQQQYNNMNNMYQQPQQLQQTSYFPLTFTSGLIGAKAFIVAPNQTAYLRDSDEGSNLLFEKSADMYGKYTIKAYRLTEVDLDNIDKPANEKPQEDFITKKDLDVFATKKELKDLQDTFDKAVNNLSYLVLKGSTKATNTAIKREDDKDDE